MYLLRKPSVARATAEVASRFYSFYSNTDYDKLFEEVYDSNALSIEPEGSPWISVCSSKLIKEKQKNRAKVFKLLRSVVISEPEITGKYFICRFDYEYVTKAGETRHLERVGVYKVEKGRITAEFFYQ